MHFYLTPFLLLKVRFENKFSCLVGFPVFFALVYWFVFLFSGSMSTIYDKVNGISPILENLNQLVSLLAAFFLAALAAVSTFHHENLDKPLVGNSVTLYHAHFQSEPEQLTRRRFLSLIFGYLSAASFAFFGFQTASPAIEKTLGSLPCISNPIFECFEYFYGYAFFMTFLFFQIVSVTFLALHYLSERMSRPEKPKV